MVDVVMAIFEIQAFREIKGFTGAIEYYRIFIHAFFVNSYCIY